jgi:hypothetical protein
MARDVHLLVVPIQALVASASFFRSVRWLF